MSRVDSGLISSANIIIRSVRSCLSQHHWGWPESTVIDPRLLMTGFTDAMCSDIDCWMLSWWVWVIFGPIGRIPLVSEEMNAIENYAHSWIGMRVQLPCNGIIAAASKVNLLSSVAYAIDRWLMCTPTEDHITAIHVVFRILMMQPMWLDRGYLHDLYSSNYHQVPWSLLMESPWKWDPWDAFKGRQNHSQDYTYHHSQNMNNHLQLIPQIATEHPVDPATLFCAESSISNSPGITEAAFAWHLWQIILNKYLFQEIVIQAISIDNISFRVVKHRSCHLLPTYDMVGVGSAWASHHALESTMCDSHSATHPLSQSLIMSSRQLKVELGTGVHLSMMSLAWHWSESSVNQRFQVV